MPEIYILFFLIIITTSYSLHLNSYQITLINKLIQNPTLTHPEKHKIHSILYKSYEKLAIKTAVDFKTKHKYKCANIKTEELILYSKYGLFKAIQNYNGKSGFAEYSNIYMQSELLKLLTDTYALSSLPKRIRRTNWYSKQEDSKINMQKYKKLLRVNLTIMYEP